MLPVTITPTSVNILLDGRMRTVQKGHINFEAVKVALRDLKTFGGDAMIERKTLDDLRQMLDIPAFIAKVTAGRVQVGDGEVRFDGEVVKGVIATRLLEMLHQGFDVMPLARFLDRVSANPIETARDEIYLWLESGNLPLTDDGCFLAFKKVKSDYSSSHPAPDGTPFYNHIGTSPWMPRDEVDTDRTNTCSRGLHFCSYQYLPHFGLGGESRVVIVKVAPEDVVSIPTDYNHSKGRAWRYAIIGEVPEDECAELFQDKSVVTSFGYYDDEVDGDFDGDIDSVHDADEDDDSGCDEDHDDFGGCAACSGDEHEDEDGDTDDDEVNNDLDFRHAQKTYTADEVTQMVKDYGQRGFARMTGVPRTTVQNWLSQIAAAR